MYLWDLYWTWKLLVVVYMVLGGMVVIVWLAIAYLVFVAWREHGDFNL